eukprot:360150-Pelagomonas_calceolata.AAC.19
MRLSNDLEECAWAWPDPVHYQKAHIFKTSRNLCMHLLSVQLGVCGLHCCEAPRQEGRGCAWKQAL